MKGTADFYNKTASDGASSGYSDESLIPALLDFAKQFPVGSKFLDLCCGCGHDSQRIHNLGYEVIGIDFSEESIRIARERNREITFYIDNILNDYSYIGKVDEILVIAGLVHIETTMLRDAFSRMHHVLTDSGRLFITIREGHGKMMDRSLKTIDGEEYDRNFIAHTKEEMIQTSEGLFSYVDEVGWDGTVWHNYIFQKQ
ncbi:MAG: class I SAM-dependent methyltransferase [Clostridia bacterium]|nr:class I SAM-dependent methyltransferase [Clostridia bacterium]